MKVEVLTTTVSEGLRIADHQAAAGNLDLAKNFAVEAAELCEKADSEFRPIPHKDDPRLDCKGEWVPVAPEVGELFRAERPEG